MSISSVVRVVSVAVVVLGAGRGRAEAPPADSQAAKEDREFLGQALGVNELEVRLGRLAAERAASPDVKAMGQKMVENHGALGRRLSDLARSAGASGDAALTPAQRETLARLEALSGAAFDDAFRKTVDAGHVDELAMYRVEVSRAASPELRALAEERVAKLEQAVPKQKRSASAKAPGGS